MTQEEKARAYDETVEKLRKFYRDYDTVSCLIDVKEELANLFPELKESEDERIRKALIDFFSRGAENGEQTNGVYDKDILAWLEKQAKHESIDPDTLIQQRVDALAQLEKQSEYKPDDTAEPKFKVGDWIVYNYNLYYINYIALQEYYECLRVDGTAHTFTSYIDSISHLWSIADAKDGDVLIDESNNRKCPFIFKETKPSNIKTNCLNPLTVLGYCGIGGAGFTKSEGWGDTANCRYYLQSKNSVTSYSLE